MGLWPLYLKRTVISTAILAVPYDAALAAIQDVPAMITLNPLVSTYEVKPDDPSTYLVTDTIKLLHFFTRRTKYTIKTELKDDGITFFVKAEGGMTSTNYWKACRREDAMTVEVSEESRIEAPFFFIALVTSTVKKTHRVLIDRLAAKLEGRQKQTVPHSNWWANDLKPRGRALTSTPRPPNLGLGRRHLSSLTDQLPAMAAIQAVHILGHEGRPTPKPHTVYRIKVQASVRSWQMWRRYSEFDDLHTELSKSVGVAPPCPLPPKQSFSLFRSTEDPKLLQERAEGLENYLRAIVSSKDDRWRETYAFKEFLGIPISKKDGVDASALSDFTSSSWLDEHTDLQNRVRDIRADIYKRDALADRGDVLSAHTTNVQAKRKLAAVLDRVGRLAGGVTALASAGLSEGEVQRRTDMVARVQDDCEKLGKMMIAARSAERAFASSVPANQHVASKEDRAALMGSAAASTSRPFARVFGAAAAPQETEQTRPLDDHGVVQLQKTKILQQDAQLSQLSTILIRQRQLGLAINQEITEQNELLDGLTEDVDNTSAKLSKAKKQLNRLDGK